VWDPEIASCGEGGRERVRGGRQGEEMGGERKGKEERTRGEKESQSERENREKQRERARGRERGRGRARGGVEENTNKCVGIERGAYLSPCLRLAHMPFVESQGIIIPHPLFPIPLLRPRLLFLHPLLLTYSQRGF